MFGSLSARHKLTGSPVKIVIFITWCYVQVIMPDILVASGFVVLPGGYTVAGINLFHGDRQTFCHSMNVRREPQGQIVNILIMFIRYDNDIAMIIWPLMRANERSDRVIMINNIALNGMNMLVRYSFDQ